jgi:hypothetical protein
MTALPVPAWPDDGPAATWDGPHGRVVYRKPTLTNMTGERTGGRASVISDRADQRIHFCYTVDGILTEFAAILTQDELFQILNDAGVFTPREIR